MTDEQDIKDTTPVPHTDDGIPTVVNGQPLSDIAIQALREAKARQAEKVKKTEMAKEIGGPAREEEPTRYGDWEKGGRVSDF
jgi:hypothetical protein